MSISRNVITLINALPEAVMLIDRKGTFAGANAVFSKLMGVSEDVFVGKRFYKLPFASTVERKLLRLFVKACHGKEETYLFPHVCPDGTVVNMSASAGKVAFDSDEYIIFTFTPVEDAHFCDSDSWKYCMALSYEPYLEFRPSKTVPAAGVQSDHMSFLRALGESLTVKFSNNAAAEFYGEKKLEGKTFSSLFSKEDDAIGFLDMLSAVGNMKCETTVRAHGDTAVLVEMNCVVKFDSGGEIAALYSSHRDLSYAERYKLIIESSRQESEFMFNQPFYGAAFLIPPRPVERPSPENLDESLDAILDQLTILRVNKAMLGIYGLDKTKFLMKSMRWFFQDDSARQVLKELFVMRETSYGWYHAKGDHFEKVAIFRATFDNFDRLSGVLVVISKHSPEFRPRYSSKKLPAAS